LLQIFFINFKGKELLGQGAFKKVYKAYDLEKGIEVAWNEVSYGQLNFKEKKQLNDEVCKKR
jgi:WNK lysine deficient protein kinase